jgi:hypothetical protein
MQLFQTYFNDIEMVIIGVGAIAIYMLIELLNVYDRIIALNKKAAEHNRDLKQINERCDIDFVNITKLFGEMVTHFDKLNEEVNQLRSEIKASLNNTNSIPVVTVQQDDTVILDNVEEIKEKVDDISNLKIPVELDASVSAEPKKQRKPRKKADKTAALT